MYIFQIHQFPIDQMLHFKKRHTKREIELGAVQTF
jgi:hypothetical protein